MSLAGALQFGLFLLLLIAFAALLGPYLARVFSGERTLLDPVLCPVERLILRALGRDARAEMTAWQYATAFFSFSVVCMIVLYVLLRLAVKLGGGPDPAALGTPLTVDLAFNTAVSFVTTTTWQAYAGESTMTYLAQTAGLTVHSFLAGASGLAVGMAFLRGFAHKRQDAAEPAAATLGNFWVDLVRALLWVLIPGALAGSIFLITQGVPMNLDPYTRATTLEGAPQVIAQGPVAALEFIKNLGTDGGGFFNVNGAHPYANPTPLVSFVQMLAIAALPAAFPVAFGRMAGRRRVGWTILAAMLCLFGAGLAVCQIAETGNLEGKEVRFGVADSVLTAVTTSNAATGSYNSMHDSFTPAGVTVPLVNMLLGEIAPGGLGSGLYSIVMVALLGLFLAGLMIGRTPSFLGFRLEAGEMKLVMLFHLVTPLAVLVPCALAAMTRGGLAGLTLHHGTHGLTEMLFAYASSAANNGQAMAGLSANSPFWNLTTAVAMLLGRFGLAVPALLLAGRFAAQRPRAETGSDLPSDTASLAVIIVVTALLVGALCYLPALALGPVAEALR